MLDKFLKKLEKEKEVYLRIKVKPSSEKTEIKEVLSDETIKINIAQIPEKNKANKELISFLEKIFNVKRGNVKIVSGHKSYIKLLKILK